MSIFGRCFSAPATTHEFIALDEHAKGSGKILSSASEKKVRAETDQAQLKGEAQLAQLEEARRYDRNIAEKMRRTSHSGHVETSAKPDEQLLSEVYAEQARVHVAAEQRARLANNRGAADRARMRALNSLKMKNAALKNEAQHQANMKNVQRLSRKTI